MSGDASARAPAARDALAAEVSALVRGVGTQWTTALALSQQQQCVRRAATRPHILARSTHLHPTTHRLHHEPSAAWPPAGLNRCHAHAPAREAAAAALAAAAAATTAAAGRGMPQLLRPCCDLHHGCCLCCSQPLFLQLYLNQRMNWLPAPLECLLRDAEIRAAMAATEGRVQRRQAATWECQHSGAAIRHGTQAT